MPDITYKFTGQGSAPYGDPVIVSDSYPQWLKDWWATLLPTEGYVVQGPPWMPTYESGVVMWPGNDGTMRQTDLNPLEFPSKATCLELAHRYAVDGKDLILIEQPFLGLGPVVTKAVRRVLGHPVNPSLPTLPAYQLADYFTNNPEDKSGAADALCKLLIARIWPANSKGGNQHGPGNRHLQLPLHSRRSDYRNQVDRAQRYFPGDSSGPHPRGSLEESGAALARGARLARAHRSREVSRHALASVRKR